MGQKTNLLTIRKDHKNVNLYNTNNKTFIYGFTFLKNLNYLLNKKGIILTNSTLNFINNISYIYLSCFFKTKILQKYKQKLIKNKKYKSKQKILNVLLNKQFKITKNNLNIIIIKNLNTKINKKKLKFFFNKLKKFIKPLFPRQFNLFLDFLKLTVLFSEKQISINTYCYILAQIFSLLTKRKHNIYFFFLKNLFTILTQKNISLINGLKIIINGKIQGKTRSSTKKIIKGIISEQSLNANIEYYKLHIFTLYGTFGIKTMVNYQK